MNAFAKKGLVSVGLATWAAIAVFVGMTLMAGHWYTLPTPDRDDSELSSALASLGRERADSEWLAVHVLYAKCRCSQRIFEHLFGSERPDLAETVLLVGEDELLERRARDAGYAVVAVSPAELKADYHMESAPLLVVLDPQDRVRYAGGYTERKQGYDVKDREIVASLVAGDPADELPAYGCGVSKELQEVLDPLGVKYDE